MLRGGVDKRDEQFVKNTKMSMAEVLAPCEVAQEKLEKCEKFNKNALNKCIEEEHVYTSCLKLQVWYVNFLQKNEVKFYDFNIFSIAVNIF